MKISKGTIIRAITLLFVILNIVLKQLGKDIINVSESQIAELLEMSLEVATIIICWWKNNSFSDKAIEADKFLNELKESEV